VRLSLTRGSSSKAIGVVEALLEDKESPARIEEEVASR